MKNEKIIAIIMAGGEGSRLKPLTAIRSKPAVPFGARYRIVDFVLSNFINSKIFTIYLLVQYKSQTLIEHIRKAWRLSPILPDQFITVVPPQMLGGQQWFQGTADAVYQNLNLIEDQRPDIVAVFGADHIYRMDISKMVKFHRQQAADVTMAALPVPMKQASSFGIIATEEDGRVCSFEEKPANPSPMPHDDSQAYASMGNYLFNTDVLVKALQESHERKENDFGRDVLPRLLKTHRLFAYDFGSSQIPGLKAHEDPIYWRDVGTIDAYFDAHTDVIGSKPLLDVFNPHWPIYSSNYQGPVAKIISGQIDNAVLGAATIIDGAKISNSIIRREVVIEPEVELDDCIIMDYVHIKRGAKLKRVIVDRHNVIEAGQRIGFDLNHDRLKYHVSEGGVVVIPRGKQHVYARDSGTGRLGYIE